MSVIEKKVWPKLFNLIKSRKKKFELRVADFKIKKGDVLILKEWDPKKRQYTEREVKRRVSFIFKFNLNDFGQEEIIKRHGLYVIELS